MKTIFVGAMTLTAAFILSTAAWAQRSKMPPRVCGDPEAACKGRSSFQPYELPVEWPKNSFIAESRPFYAIILKSAKTDWNFEKCDQVYSNNEILGIQGQWPNNKVFALKCAEPGYVYYTGVDGNYVFIAVYAGESLAQANRFLKTVRNSSDAYRDVKLRKMRAGVNGT
jgi:hypothetical protein